MWRLLEAADTRIDPATTIDETRAFNMQLEALLAMLRPVHTVPPAASRAGTRGARVGESLRVCPEAAQGFPAFPTSVGRGSLADPFAFLREAAR